MNHVSLNFSNTFLGELKTEKGSVQIGQVGGALSPYELLAGALGSCLYATFLDVIHKMRLEFSECTLDVVWEKREEVPTVLKTAHIKAVINGADTKKSDKYERAFKLATEYCSVYYTLSQVAEITWEIAIFEDAK